MKIKTLVAGAIAAATLFGAASTAGAVNRPEPTGWDGVNDLVIGGGSDTTYNFMQNAELLYNGSQGCETDNTSGSATIGQCKADPNAATETKGNWDHDRMSGKYPTGSGAGIKELQLGTVDYARSSRAPKSSGETDLNFWAYGKDGLAVVTFGARTPGNLTTAQLKNIYNCTITTWDQITGDPADAGKTITPVGMNTASGTKATFDTYLGFDANAGSCVKKLSISGAASFFAFENDVKPLLQSTTATDANALDGTNLDNAIWWMSYAEWKAFSYKRQSASVWSVDGQAPSSATISSNAYPITRFIYHVTRKVDATPDASTDNVVGATVSGSPAVYTADAAAATGGKQGGVREFTEFLCKSSANHANNDFSGLTQYTELGNVYTKTGFIRVPVAERTNGICKVLPG